MWVCLRLKRRWGGCLPQGFLLRPSFPTSLSQKQPRSNSNNIITQLGEKNCRFFGSSPKPGQCQGKVWAMLVVLYFPPPPPHTHRPLPIRGDKTDFPPSISLPVEIFFQGEFSRTITAKMPGKCMQR